MKRRYRHNVSFLCVVLFASSFLASISRAGNLDEYFQVEASMVSSSRDIYTSGVFYIKAFGCLIPIPNRFVLVSSDYYQAAYSSMSGMQFGQEVIIGSIAAGRHRIKSKTLFEVNLSRFARIGDDEEGIGVSIYEQVAPISPITQIILSDGNEYLLISDQNAGLWKAILKGARKLK